MMPTTTMNKEKDEKLYSFDEIMQLFFPNLESLEKEPEEPAFDVEQFYEMIVKPSLSQATYPKRKELAI